MTGRDSRDVTRIEGRGGIDDETSRCDPHRGNDDSGRRARPPQAGGATDAALGLGAFAVFNQFVRGETIFHSLCPAGGARGRPAAGCRRGAAAGRRGTAAGGVRGAARAGGLLRRDHLRSSTGGHRRTTPRGVYLPASTGRSPHPGGGSTGRSLEDMGGSGRPPSPPAPPARPGRRGPWPRPGTCPSPWCGVVCLIATPTRAAIESPISH